MPRAWDLVPLCLVPKPPISLLPKVSPWPRCWATPARPFRAEVPLLLPAGLSENRTGATGDGWLRSGENCVPRKVGESFLLKAPTSKREPNLLDALSTLSQTCVKTRDEGLSTKPIGNCELEKARAMRQLPPSLSTA